jgi:hypothetical protein
MLRCSVLANRTLLTGFKYILFEMVAHYLSIAQCAPAREREPRSVPQVWPCGRTVLKSGLKWSVT